MSVASLPHTNAYTHQLRAHLTSAAGALTSGIKRGERPGIMASGRNGDTARFTSGTGGKGRQRSETEDSMTAWLDDTKSAVFGSVH